MSYIKGFWKEYRWLSNFHPCTITYNGMTYLSTEAAYQASKCEDLRDRLKFVGIPANYAKTLGQRVKIRSDWDDVKYDVMLDITVLKYQDPSLRKLLLGTADSYLEETNHWGDRYWGVCKGVGKNNLGKILMQVRDMYRVSA